MAFIPVPNTVQVSLGFELSGEVGSNNIHFTKSTPWSLADMALLDAYINTWLQSFPKVQFANTFAWKNYRIMNLESDSAPVIESVPSPAVAGTSAGPQTPNMVAFVVTFRTLNRGRSYRGRVYQAGLTETVVAGNEVTTAFADAVEAWWDDLIVVAPPASSSLAVVSRYTGGQPRATGIATPVTGMTTNLRVDSQRRRMPR